VIEKGRLFQFFLPTENRQGKKNRSKWPFFISIVDIKMSDQKLLLKKDLVAFVKYNGKESLTLDLGEVYKWKIYNNLCVIYE
jgi:hypothetical protein